MYHDDEKLERRTCIMCCRSYLGVMIGVVLFFIFLLLNSYAFSDASISNDLANKYTQIAEYLKQEQINLEYEKEEFAKEVVRIAQPHLFVYIYIYININIIYIISSLLVVHINVVILFYLVYLVMIHHTTRV